jgi:hypothetical protein
MAASPIQEQALRELEEAITHYAALCDPSAPVVTVVATVETITIHGAFNHRRYTWRFDRDLHRSA